MIIQVSIPVGANQTITADVAGEPNLGIVLFVHGSGSSRLSSRNRHVAEVLQEGGLQTVLLDLLTEEEDRQDMQTREHRFDIDLLTGRVLKGMQWLRAEGRNHPVGLFGASTGAAAALRAAAAEPEEVKAVVSRGGRPDLARSVIPEVKAPTLLIVGGKDGEVIQLNERALADLNQKSSLEIVPEAGHLFEEPGKLDEVAASATSWFQDWLAVS